MLRKTVSKKSSLDILGESHIPSDLLTPTLGSNYGLDGFEDMQYGMGVLEGVLDPSYTEAPALPTGVQLASSEELDLNDMLEDKVPLTDLTWLDPSQLQNPERLPKTPISIPELEEAWGRSTDGVRVWVRDLDDANYQASLTETPVKKALLTPDHIRKVVGHAMRRSVRGHDIKTIFKEALDSVGTEAKSLLPYLMPMREEHGLAGNVFVRASAYPNWGTGKWASEVKKWASRAKYIVVSEQDIQGATWIEGGRCKYTSKLAVTEVPWQEALEHYKPLLDSTSRRVAGGDPKKALQAAFLSLPEKKKISPENLPVHIAPSQRVSKKEAREAFQNYTPEKKVYDPTASVEARKREIAEAKVCKFVSANLISQDTKDRILASGASPEDMVREAVLEATKIKPGTYTGDANAVNKQRAFEASISDRKSANSAEAQARLAAHREEGWKNLISKWVQDKIVTASEVTPLLKEHGTYQKVSEVLLPKALRATAQIRKEQYGGTNRALAALQVLEDSRQERRAQDLESRKQELETVAARRASEATLEHRAKKELRERVAKVQNEISRGLRGEHLRNFIAKTIPQKDAPEALRLLKGSLSALRGEQKETRVYDQTQFSRVASEKTSKSVLAGQISKAANWLRRTMSEGFAGKDLDEIVSKRLSDSLRQASESQFREIRAKYEGISGFLYVDAEAYASPAGVAGCEQGALKHRANTISSVAEMDRCSSCSMVRTLENGTRKCAVYNKVLSDFSGEDLSEIKSKNIRAANMTDVEITTSYFSPKYDPSEFGLENNSLEGITFDLPEDEKISDVTFGGWDF